MVHVDVHVDPVI